MKKENKFLKGFNEGRFSCGTIIGVTSSIISICISIVLIYYGFKTGFVEVLIAGFALFVFYSLLLFIETKAFIRKIK